MRARMGNRRSQKLSRTSFLPASEALFECAPLEPRLLLSGHVAVSRPVPTPRGWQLHVDKVNVRLLKHLARTVDTGAAATTTTNTTTTTTVAAFYALNSIPALSSNASASAKLYLDFLGDPATTWGSYKVPITPAYDQDGDPTTFSDGELASIRQIWARVAESYSPFNINVTTVEPGTLADKVAMRVVIGGNGSWMGASYGGFAYVGSFYNSSPNTAYVFPANLGNGNSVYTSDAAAHEAGHGFGLQHQSSYDSTGTKIAEYNQGNSQIAPIMGFACYSARALWRYGTSSISSTSMQDDMAILSGTNDGFGYRTDAVGNTLSTATPFTLSGSTVSASGIIEKTSDRDYFSFTTDAGTVSFTGAVATYGPMLDLKLELWTSAGSLLATADTASLGETLSLAIPAGSYRLVVASHGGYGDVGQYAVTGTVVPPINYVAAPTGLTASIASASQINLAWADQSSNETGFVIQRSIDNGVTWNNLATTLANVASSADMAVLPGSTYSYRVYATGAANSDFSNIVSATTVPAAPSGLSAVAVSSSQINLAWSNVAGETGYRIERSADGLSGWAAIASVAGDATTCQNTALAMGTTYSYRVIATGTAGDSAASNIASATTQVVSIPAAPSNLTATTLARNKIKLTWIDNSNNETSFKIQRSTDNVNFSLRTALAANSVTFTDSGLKRGTYYYRIIAANAAGDSAFTPTAFASMGQAVTAKGALAVFSTRPIAADPAESVITHVWDN